MTTDPGADFHPAVSPHGIRIAFLTTRNGNREIYVMDADSSNRVRLTKNSVPEMWPTFAKIGR